MTYIQNGKIETTPAHAQSAVSRAASDAAFKRFARVKLTGLAEEKIERADKVAALLLENLPPKILQEINKLMKKGIDDTRLRIQISA